ncbi:PilZ domain-containing protein [Candidatus Sumerlaeota bacterium]|nr:PilZ domain-containing protein [Candidatus Sumerlaeota bacterium]
MTIQTLPNAESAVTLHSVDLPDGDMSPQVGRLLATDGKRHTIGIDDGFSPQRLEEIASTGGLELSWISPELGQMSVPVHLEHIDERGRQVTVEIVERRTHLRVDSSLLFRHVELSEAEFTELSQRIISEPLGGVQDTGDHDRSGTNDDSFERLDLVLSNFHRMLRELSAKVDMLIAIQRGEEPEESRERSSRVINISGAGLAYESDEVPAVGTRLKMTFDLSFFPYVAIICLGEITRVDHHPSPPEGTPSHLVYVRFTHIREEDRDRIIRYVFKMQRRILRRRRLEADAQV